MNSILFLYIFSYCLFGDFFVLLVFCLYIVMSDFVLLWTLLLCMFMPLCVCFLCFFKIIVCFIYLSVDFLKSEKKKRVGWVGRWGKHLRSCEETTIRIYYTKKVSIIYRQFKELILQNSKAI